MTLRSFLDRYSRYAAPCSPDDLGGGGSSPPAGSGTSGGSSGSSSSGSSPGVSSPVPTDSAASGGDPGTPGPASGSEYNFLNEIFGDTSTSPPPAAPTPVQAPQVEAAPAQVAPVPPPQPVAAPAPAPAQSPAAQAQPGQTQPPAQGASESFDPADPVSLARGLVQNYDAAIQHLASTAFALSPQDMEALETDVAGTVPKLLARVAVYMQAQVLTQMGRIIPQMIQRQGEVTSTHSRNVDSFYTAWPSIDRTKHDGAVREIASRFRQLNPDMPTDKMIETIGPYVLMSLGLPLVPMAKPGAAQRSAAPRPTNGQVQHFQPAAPGAVTVQQQPVDDQFGYMGATS
jgi:hypothetical protein